jgi:hypothetical protein
MKKIFLLSLIGFSILNFNSSAQAPLPSSYGFEGFSGSASMPPGWTSNITGAFTYATGQNGVAAKLDAVGEYVQVFTADPMGAVTFYLQGWIGGTATVWTGTFKVQESANGNTFTDLASYTTLNNNNYQQYTVNPASASRYLKWVFTTKASGCNVGLDEINIPLAAIQTPRIGLQQNSTTIFNGGTSQAFGSNVGTPTTINLTLNNLSVAQDLLISNVSFGGANANNYSNPTFPNSISPNGNGNLSFTFNPSASGSLPATLTITSNDPDQGSFLVNLYGVGGILASEPTVQATNLAFTSVKAFRYKTTFAAASPQPDGGYLVLRKIGSAVTETPVDGTVYSKGDYIGGAQVAYKGTIAGSFYPKYVVANTDYHFAVFAFNGSGTFTNYKTDSPLTGSVTSGGADVGGYYGTLSTTNSNFPSALQAVINPHTATFYSNYEQTMVRLFASRDTTGGQSVVTCVYSGDNRIYNGTLNWTNDNFSREHTYCKSWMPTNPAGTGGPGGSELPEYNDQHHLFPVNQNDANGVRSNNPLGEVVTVTSTFLGAKYGKDANGKYVYEPRDIHKGDAARAMFYMCANYNGVTNHNWSLPSTTSYNQDQDVLKKWHYQDPPSNWEIARNEFVDSLQGNRNPFIDNPDWVCYIDFKTMNYIANPAQIPCSNVGMNAIENPISQVSVFPNPSTDFANVSFNASKFQNVEVSILDITGKVLVSNNYTASNGNNQYPINVSGFARGNYFVKIVSAENSSLLKFTKD